MEYNSNVNNYYPSYNQNENYFNENKNDNQNQNSHSNKYFKINETLNEFYIKNIYLSIFINLSILFFLSLFLLFINDILF